jgi:AcrR family transcriptional regulator
MHNPFNVYRMINIFHLVNIVKGCYEEFGKRGRMDDAIEPAARRRHPVGRGYSRGEEARFRIIRVAIDAFGSHGYEGASTRAIAEMAGVTTPALQYYFGGKQGLYLACADHIATTIGTRLALSLEDGRQALARRDLSREDLIMHLHNLLTSILYMLLESTTTEVWPLFLLREQASPTTAFDCIFEKIQGPVIGLCTKLIARLSNLPDDDPQVVVTALALYGLITFFRFARESTLRVLKTKELNELHLREISTVLFAQLSAIGRPQIS